MAIWWHIFLIWKTVIKLKDNYDMSIILLWDDYEMTIRCIWDVYEITVRWLQYDCKITEIYQWALRLNLVHNIAQKKLTASEWASKQESEWFSRIKSPPSGLNTQL